MSRIYKIEGHPDCNRCDRFCPHSFKFKYPDGKVVRRRGMAHLELSCSLHRPPKEGWSFAELALAHPQSLQTLEGLPFDVRMHLYI